MQGTTSARPRVSRETRLLLTTVLISIAVLWVLARLRFPERAAPANPVSPVLTQIAPRSGFADLAAEVSDLQGRVLRPFVPLEFYPGRTPITPTAPRIAALRVRQDLALALLEPTPEQGPGPVLTSATVVAHDLASGLLIVSVPPQAPPELQYWAPRRAESSRYMLVTDLSEGGLTLRPVFIGAFHASDSPVWGAPVWTVPAHTDIRPGTFLFTTTGALAGLVIDHEGLPGIVPAEWLLGLADRLVARGSRAPGWLGIEVQPLTPALAGATRVPSGLIVSWVDPDGPGATSVRPLDVIETIDRHTEATPPQWRARTSRIAPGDVLRLRIRRGDRVEDVELTAAEAAARRSPLGLVMRGLRMIGTEVVSVEAGSAGARAGVQPGDLITIAGPVRAPSPAQVAQVFSSARPGSPVLFGLSRGTTRLVIAIEP